LDKKKDVLIFYEIVVVFTILSEMTRLRKNFSKNIGIEIHSEGTSFFVKTYSKFGNKITKYFPNEMLLMKTDALALMEAKSLLK
jgi:uncharacterized FlaG/YvyC family protein